VHAWVTFVYVVLLGMLMVGSGSILVAFEPTNAVWVGQSWFITLGYTLELVPLLAKILAINQVVAATHQRKQARVHMRSRSLWVVGVVVVVIGFLTIWTTVDPTQRHEGRHLKEVGDVMEVVTTVVCASDSTSWGLVVLCWNGILVLCATVLAFQSRKVKGEFNDFKSLRMMIYSHFMFALLRVIMFGVSANQISLDEGERVGSRAINPSTLATANSLLLSLDVITAVTKYVVPKLVAVGKSPQGNTGSTTTASTGVGIRAIVPSREVPEGSTTSLKIQSISTTVGLKEIEVTDPTGQGGHVPESTTIGSSGPCHMNLGMVGNIDGDEEDESVSSQEEDWGGPRFAVPMGTSRRSGLTNLSIDVIREGDESASSVSSKRKGDSSDLTGMASEECTDA